MMEKRDTEQGQEHKEKRWETIKHNKRNKKRHAKRVQNKMEVFACIRCSERYHVHVSRAATAASIPTE